MEIVIIDQTKATEDYSCQFSVNYAMVIDDVEEDIYVLEKMIERYCFCKQLIKCNNAIDALAYLQQHADSSDKLPEIIFLDLAMPELNGVEFLEHFSRLPASIRKRCSLYVYSSSKMDEDVYMNGKHPLVAGFVPKPINLIFLLGVNSDHEQRFYSDHGKRKRQPA
jgi:CheY-like chemotaxis protein